MKKVLFLSVCLMGFVLSHAQGVKRFEAELIPLGLGGSVSEGGPYFMIGCEFRLNSRNTPLDYGVQANMMGSIGEVFAMPEEDVIDLVTVPSAKMYVDYNFNHLDENPFFVGLGIGVADVREYFTLSGVKHHVRPVLAPRAGVEYGHLVRLTFESQLLPSAPNSFCASLGIVLGGRVKK